MQIELVVALLTAGSALVVALTTGVFQIMQQRTGRRSELSRVREQRLNEQLGRRAHEIQEGLRKACKGLQRMQDEIFFLTSTKPDIHVPQAQRRALVDARDYLLDVYRDYHTVLTSHDRDNLNDARKRVVNMVLGLQLNSNFYGETYSLNRSMIAELERAATFLNTYHQRLLISATSASHITGLEGENYGKYRSVR